MIQIEDANNESYQEIQKMWYMLKLDMILSIGEKWWKDYFCKFRAITYSQRSRSAFHNKCN